MLLLLSIGVGCARTVSPPEDVLFLEMKFSTRENINLQDNIYIIAFSESRSVDIQPQTVDREEYYIFPSKHFSDTELSNFIPPRDINYYYSDIFDSWKSFIYISEGETSFISSDESSFNSTTTDNFQIEPKPIFEVSQSLSSSTLTLTLDIEQLQFSKNETLYFKIFSVEKLDSSSIEGNSSGKIFDTSNGTNSISLSLFNDQSQNLIESLDLPGSLDLKKWEFRLY